MIDFWSRAGLMKTPLEKPKARKKAATKGVATKKVKRKKSPKKLVDDAIQSIGNRLETEEVKGTLGDLIRLIQVKKELDGEKPRAIEVKWVEK